MNFCCAVKRCNRKHSLLSVNPYYNGKDKNLLFCDSHFKDLYETYVSYKYIESLPHVKGVLKNDLQWYIDYSQLSIKKVILLLSFFFSPVFICFHFFFFFFYID